MEGRLMTHGTISFYTNRRCRCPECRAAWRAYARHRRRDPLSRTVPAGETREHVVRLLGRGHSATAIADVAGLSRGAVQNIARGKTASVRRVSAEAILGITLDEAMGGHYVPADMAARLLREMQGAGLPLHRIKAAAGLHHKHQIRGRVTWTTWRRLSVLYALLARRGMVDGALVAEVAR